MCTLVEINLITGYKIQKKYPLHILAKLAMLRRYKRALKQIFFPNKKELFSVGDSCFAEYDDFGARIEIVKKNIREHYLINMVWILEY